jgi:hypothetical protein
VDLCSTFQFLSTPCDELQHYIDHFPIVLGASSLEDVKIDWKLDTEATLQQYHLREASRGRPAVAFPRRQRKSWRTQIAYPAWGSAYGAMENTPRPKFTRLAVGQAAIWKIERGSRAQSKQIFG